MENKNTHITYGLITGIVMVVLGLTYYLAGIAFKPVMGYVSQIPFLVGIILNAVAFSKVNDGYVKFGNVFGSCFKMVMIVTIILIVWSMISVYAFPQLKVKALEVAREGVLSKSPNMSDEQVETSMNLVKKYWNAFMIAGLLFGNLFYGVIFSLIGAAIAKKKGEPPITVEAFRQS